MHTVFSIGESLKFGWQKTKSNSMLLFQVLLTFFAYNVLTSIVQTALQGTFIGFLASLALIAVGVFIGVGFLSIILKVARGEHAVYRDLVPPLKTVWRVFLASLVSGILICLGILLLVIPGIYLLVRFSMVRFAALDGSKPLESLSKSSELTNGVKWQLLGFFLVFLALNILGALALLVGLLVSIPVTMIAYAHIYEKLKHTLKESPENATVEHTSA